MDKYRWHGQLSMDKLHYFFANYCHNIYALSWTNSIKKKISIYTFFFLGPCHTPYTTSHHTITHTTSYAHHTPHQTWAWRRRRVPARTGYSKGTWGRDGVSTMVIIIAKITYTMTITMITITITITTSITITITTIMTSTS